MKAELIEDKDRPGDFRVEAIDEDGGVEVAIFSGPDALGRAIAFAGGGYYESWGDPQDHAGVWSAASMSPMPPSPKPETYP